MNLFQQAAESEKLIGEFKALYIDGAEDVVLRDKAEEIFGQLDKVEMLLGRDRVVMQLLEEMRKSFAIFVVDVYRNRHAPELKKFYFLYKKKHR